MPQSKITKAGLITEIDTLRIRVGELERQLNLRADGGFDLGSKSPPPGRAGQAKRTEPDNTREHTKTVATPIPVLIAFVDAEQRLRFNNQSYLEWFGSQRRDSGGKHLREVLGDITYQKILPRVQAALAGHEQAFEWETPGASGETRIIQSHYVPHFGENEAVLGFDATVLDITEFRRAEEELRASQRLLQTVFDAIPHGIFVRDKEGRYLMVNEVLANRYGLKTEEFAGKHLGDIVSDLGIVRDWQSYLQSDQEVFRTGRRVSLPDRLLEFPDGSPRTVHTVKSPLHNEAGEVVGVVGVTEDITERKRAEEELRDNQQLLRTVIDAIPLWISVQDPQGNRLLVNQNLLDLWGQSREAELPPAGTYPHLVEEERPLIESYRRKVVEEGQSLEYERARKTGKDSQEWVRARWVPLRDSKENIIGSVVVTWDITERKQAEEAYRESEKRFRAVIDHSPNNIYLKDLEGNYLLVNRVFEETIGVSVNDIYGKKATDWAHSEFAEAYIKHDREVIDKGVTVVQEEIVPYADGTLHTHIATKFPIFNENGILVSMGGINTDITDRKRAEEELRRSKRLLESVFRTVPTLIWVKDRQGKYVMVTREFSTHYGGDIEDFIGSNLLDLGYVTPSTQQVWDREDHDVFETGATVEVLEQPIDLQTGERRWQHLIKVPLRDDSGEITHLVGVGINVTARKRAEEELRESQRLLQTVFDTIPHWVYVKDRESRYLAVNKAMASEFHLRPEDFLGAHTEEFRGKSSIQIGTKDELKSLEEMDRKVLEAGEFIEEPEVTLTLADGSKRIHRIIKLPFKNEQGEVQGIVGLSEDITEFKNQEALLRKNEAEFRQMVENIPSAIFLKDLNGRYRITNRTFEEWMGIHKTEFYGKTVHDLYPVEEATFYVNHDREVLKTGHVLQIEMEFDTREGLKSIISNKFPMLDDKGDITGIGVILTDITAQRKTEEQLRQAQKMDVIGQLAGGVAHDFNNLLQVIIGYTQITLENREIPEKIRSHLRLVKESADQAAELVGQLLAFSRKQTLEFHLIDLNELIARQMKMVRRVIGENIKLELRFHAAGSTVKGNAGALEQVVLNLCINARDAMPDGGLLWVELDTVSTDAGIHGLNSGDGQGHYACISVRDTGIGMAPGVLEHIFEPFFTTKEVGKGSGLGLSMAYGILQQHAGMIDVESEPGAGSTFKIYIPLVPGEPADETPAAESIVPGSGETILLAEDEEDVLDLVAFMLESIGYRVLKAATAREALQLLAKRTERIDLALLDVVMPEMGGRELYEKITQIRPSLPVVFNTGYAADTIDSQFLEDHNIRLLHKPYTPDELSKTIRESIERTG